MSHTRRQALVTLLTLLVLGGSLLSLHRLQTARAASGTASAQNGQRRPAPANPGISKPVAPNAPAATFTVSNLLDSGAGSLRQAITDANAAPGADTITFIVTGTINLASVLPAIEQNLTITGPGATQLTVRRDTGGNYRIFQINVATTVSISGLTLTNGNVTGDGGGIHNSGNLTVTECAVTTNTATNVGGGILNLGTLNVLRSTLSGNTATTDGGGLWTSNGSATLTNCTISGNTATTFTGGISIVSNGVASTLSLTHCTVASNNGTTEGGIATVNQGGGATTTLRNNIVANNSAPNLAVIGASASVVSQGFNLSSDNSVALLNQMTDLNNTNPLLAALANNFGPTQTHALNTGSPALDKGNSFSVTTDQRGLPRLSDDSGITNAGDGADIGAFEAQPGVNGTAAADAFVVTRSGANIVVTQNAVQVFNQPRTSTTSLTINGLGGNDTLTIDASGGNPFPAGGILFDGGADADSITLQNGNFASGISTPSGPSSGTLVYSGGTTGAAKLTYANLEPITDTNVVANYTINGTLGVDTINMVNGPGGTIQVNSGTTPTFELINFSNKTNVTVIALAGADTVNILARAGITNLTVSGNEGDDRLDASATTAGAGSIFLNGVEDSDTLIGGADDDTLDGGAGNDTFLGNGGTDNIGGGAIAASGDTILVPGTAAGDTIALAISSGKLQVTINGTTTTYGNFIGGAIATSGIDLVSVNADAGNDTVTVNSTEATIPTNIATGADDDAIVFADGVSLNGGTIDGGANTDTLNYSAYTTAATVNLGLGSTGLSATLSGSQEVPPQTTAATGTVAVSNYNPVTKTFDIAVTVTDLAPADVTGFHLHRAPVGVNGAVIIDLQPLAPLTPAGSGFTFNATGVALPAQHEAALLGGITYVNIHTAAAPNGLIRGQVFTNGNVNLATGTATGTSSISNVENVTGGQNGDSLVGNFSANTLLGGPGDDTLVGAPGSDTFNGDAGADVLVWSNGDGSDVMDGGAESDTVQVNGNITAGDVFTTAASGPRIAFARTSSGPFSLDIGTVETLTVNGVGGDDSFTVNALTSATDLSLLQLFGFDGNDTFNLTPVPNGATRTINANGGAPTTAPGDVLDLVTAGVTDPLLTLTGGNGTFTATSHQTINLTSIENTSAPTAAPTAANVVTGGATSHAFTVTYTGDTAINIGTLDGNDVRVTGPGGFDAAATFVSVDVNSNGSPRVATYSITPPGGSWDTADNGPYNVVMQASQVADNLGNFVAAGTPGTFTVNIVAPIVVTTVADEQNVNGQCSLREALLNANANNQSGSTDCGTGGGSPDTINFSALFNSVQTINLASVLPNLTDGVTINGPGANLLTVRRDTGGDYVVFEVNAGITAILSGLTITNGRASFGGGVRNAGNLTINECAITANTSTGNGGGVVNNGGTLTINRSTISGNTSLDGAVVNQGGGGGATATLTNSTISGNTATNTIAGIANVNFGGPATTLTMLNCTVTGNTSPAIGGIRTLDQGGAATTTLKNTIVANNSLLGLSITGTNASVVSQGNNLASDNGGGFLTGTGDLINSNPLLLPLADNGGPTLTHALLLGSPALDNGSLAAGVTTDQRGLMRPFDIGSIPPASNGNDSDIGAFEAQTVPPSGILINDVAVAEGNAGTSTATFNVTLTAASAQPVTVQFATADGTATAGSDYVAVSGTLTFSPGITSQPVNVTLNGDTSVEPGETFFVNLTSPTNAGLVDPQGRGLIINDEPYIVTNANDSGAGSLRQALLDANTNSSGAQTILFEPVFFSTARTINLASVLPNIASSVTINGPGANLLTVRRDTGGNYRIFTINTGQTVTLSGLTITEGNVTGSGGGIRNSGTLTVTNCQISGNTASTFGGGIFNNGTLTVTGSTIANNNANGSGGTSGGIDNSGSLTLLNTTISGNSATNADGGNGGGLWTQVTTTITNCTITNNLAAGSNSAGGVLRVAGTTTIRNSLIAVNQNNNTVPDVLAAGNTGITSSGFNLIGNVGTVTAFNQTGDLTGTGTAPLNPVLGALGNNGGPTQTHALLAGSPAINAGTATGAPATDQRGVSRPQGAAVDIGAFELITNPLIVTNANDAGAGSLRQALLDSNLNPGANTISFSAFFNTAQTITLTSGELVIDSNLTINGTGANLLTVSGNNSSRVFQINAGFTVSMSGLTVTGGSVTGDGGGIRSLGILNLSNCAITNNTATVFSGGIDTNDSLSVTNCTISGNSAANGGGIASVGTVNIVGSSITGNTAAFQGGGLNMQFTNATLTNSTISGNTANTPAPNAGGGISFGGASGSSTLQVNNCTITGNLTATANSGGGLSVVSDGGTHTAVLRNSIIAGNALPNLKTEAVGGGAATITSQGFNLTSDGGGGFLTGTGDLPNTNPLLTPLANHGGPTPTHALLPGSPAINAGTNTLAPATDQRGIVRPQQTTTDIGAFESRGFTLAVTSGSPQSAALNAAFANPLIVTVSSANSEPVQGGRVTFTPPGSGASATLTGSPATIAANGQASVTAMANATVGGPYNIAANTGGAAAAVNFALTNNCQTITVNAPAVNTGTAGVSFSQTFTQTGGSGATTFSLSTGTLPTGLTLDAAGLLAGTPTQTGSFPLTIKATDSNNCMGTVNYTLTISAAGPIVVTTAADELNTNGQCSLREALLNANANNQSGSTDCGTGTSGTDVINFSALFNTAQTINLASALPDLTNSLTINGPGANLLTIQRSSGGNYRLFTINAGTAVELLGLTLTGGNVTGNGGAILNSGTLTIRNSQISGNTASSSGGGIRSTGALTITGSAIVNNTANGSNTGGGIETSGGSLTLVNTTISGNSATGSLGLSGGGIWTNSPTNMFNCTIANNSATGADSAGGLRRASGTTTLVNTLIAANQNNTAMPDVIADQNTGITSSGNNLIGNVGALTAFNQTGDLTGTGANPLNPLLAALANYGGPTSTHALLPGSPAINAANSGIAPTVDQRGIARVGTTDIGAFESRGFTLAATSGGGQSALINNAFLNPLVATVSSAFSEPVQGGRVSFTAPGSGASAALSGSPATIAANGQASVTATANGLGGSYNVAANAIGAAAVVNFALTNTTDMNAPTASVMASNVTTGGGTSYQFTITYSDNLAINVSTLGNGDANVTGPGGFNVAATFVSVNLNSNGTPRTATYTITPPGGSWDSTDSGTYSVVMNASQVADTNGNFVAASTLGTFSVTICPIITVNPATLPNGRAGVPYSQTFTQTGGAGAGSFSVSAGALPSGLTLAAGGLLSGTPTVSGTFNFTVRTTDSNGCTGERAYTLLLNPACTTITVNPATLPNGFQGTAYSQTLTATGGTAPYTFNVTSGSLPGGLTLASGGALTGTPTTSGTFSFSVTATDSTGCTGVRAYTVIVSGNGLQFFPLAAPVRLLDTRAGQVACTQPNAPIAGQTSLTQAGRSTCGIPANAVALTGNLTTVNSGGGFLTLYPSNAVQPTVASVNYAPNEIINNVFTVGLGTDGAFKIFAFNTTDVVVDVTGYYAPPATGGLFFHPLPKPIRLLETRAGQLGCTTPGTPIQAGDGGTLTQQARITCDGVTIPSGALAIVGNATTVNPQGVGFLTLFPGNATRPLAAASNYGLGQIVNGPFSVGLAPNGEFKIYTFATTDLVVDVLGYYSTDATDANGAGLLFSPLPKPVRLLETRAGQPVGCNLPGAPLTGQQEYTQVARGTCDGVTVPTNALGVVGNATVVQPLGPGFLTLWPSSAASRPTVATANYSPGEVTNRHFIVGLGSGDGAFKMYSFATSHLVVDLSGYFAP